MNQALSATLIAVGLAGCGSTMPPDDASRADSSNTADAADDVEMGSPSPRDFTLIAHGLAGVDAQGLGVWVTEMTGNTLVGFGRMAAIGSGDLTLRMPDLLADGDYRADVFIDANNNGTYDGPSVDPSWRLPVPAQGSGTVSFAMSGATEDISSPARVARGDLRAMLQGFTAEEVGHRLELRVIQADPPNATVGAFVEPSVPAGGRLTVQLPGIVEDGATYRVDFWVDVDGSGDYGNPPADHAWRVMVTANGGAVVNWSRSEMYSVLDWR